MEETNHWTWPKRKYNLISRLQPPTDPNLYGDSWEEQAFAVDAAGLIGGCVWPPRSYSCSFCRREFRSAQALGGHMNVHRRDRARLNQSPYPHNDGSLHHHHHQDHFPNPCASLGCNHNYPEPDPAVVVSPSLASRVFLPTPVVQQNRGKGFFLPTISPPTIKNIQNRGKGFFLPTISPPTIENILNQFVPSSRPNLVADVYKFKEEEAISCKRKRTTDSNSSGENTHLQSEVLELSFTSTEDEEEEEVDLELRLGHAPA